MAPIRVIQYGLGPIGAGVARLAADRPGLALVGAVDIDPAKVGADAGEVLALGRRLGFPVTATLAETLARTGADVVLHATSSYFDQFEEQIHEILGAGLDIVSTAEELSFPWLAHRQPAERIDAAARKAGKTVLGTGVNPGFLMDALPLGLSGLCQRVERIEIDRVIDASTRRGPFQKKIGSGMSVEEFEEAMAAGRMGHVGLPESIGMLFDTLGRELVRIEDTVEPVVAEVVTETDHFRVEPGEVKGLRQVARGFDPDGEFVTLTFVAALAMQPDGDAVRLHGHPEIEVQLRGTNGDVSTAAIVANAVPRVHAAPPGLLTMRDLPVVHAG